MSASLIGLCGSSTFQAFYFSGFPLLRFECLSRARASLRNRHLRPFHHGVRRRGGTIYWSALPLGGRSKRTYELTSSIVPRGTSLHRLVELNVLLSYFLGPGAHATAPSRLHWNSVPSTHMRCMITASLRASATIAFFIPRSLAIFIAQTLSQDHLVERTNMT